MPDKFHPAEALVALAGARLWDSRMATLARAIGGSQRVGRALLRRHGVELALERLRRRPNSATPADHRLLTLARAADMEMGSMSRTGRARFRAALRAGLRGENALVGFFHLLRTAALHRARGFGVCFAGFEDEAPFDLLIRRNGIEAEIACDVISAEEGRDVHRGAWVRLVDRIDPDLQTWLAAHPGRYLLKLTLPQGLRDQTGLAALHGRIRTLLAGDRRADQDAAAVLRLDPLMLAAAQADENGLLSSLRREYGHEAHLAVTAAGRGVFVLAARAGREDEVAVAIRRRMATIAPTRLTGTRPGILAMFVEDIERADWRHLREKLELEGEARQFLTDPVARRVVAVSCASRLELLGAADAAPEGELRFRNPAHPASRTAALEPAVASFM